MSIMCKMDGQCETKKRMCGHEKMMLLVMMAVAIGLGGHFVFHWF